MEESNDINSSGFCAGIVLYNPDDLGFIESIKILLELRIDVIIYDNSSSNEHYENNTKKITSEFGDSVTVLNSLVGNIGLAAAFNCIVTHIMKINTYKGIFIFDQDTNLNLIALTKLISAFNDLQKDSKKLGIIAGYPFRKENMPYRIKPLQRYPGEWPSIVNVKNVSSSFSLIPTKTFSKIGIFNETFFIDHIDMDFSMRCWKAGLPVCVQTEAKFIHNIGVGDVVVFNKFLFPIAHSYRHYYQVRNMIISYRENQESMFVILKEILLRTVVVSVISINSGDARSRFKYLFKGIKDGFKGVSGKLST